MELSAERVRARLRAPFIAAWGSLSERELVLVRLEDGAGNAGFGEAAPLPRYGAASIEDVVGALERCREAVADLDAEGARAACRAHSPPEVLAACRALSPPPEVLAAVDLALWDLEGRRLRTPVWKLLGADSAPSVVVNAMVATPDDASEAARRGFRCVKMKVGLGDDSLRVAAVREAIGPDVAIRIDANGAWSVEEAVGALNELSRFGIELCEEPVHGLEAIASVASAVSVPVSLDESVALPGALDEQVCDAVCLKVAGCGGLSGLLAACKRARATGYRIYLASTLDGPLGIAASLHAAAVVRPELASGLATLSMFADRGEPLRAHRGLIAVPDGPGLGHGLIDWYRRGAGPGA